jgi:hypothetical protein
MVDKTRDIYDIWRDSDLWWIKLGISTILGETVISGGSGSNTDQLAEYPDFTFRDFLQCHDST